MPRRSHLSSLINLNLPFGRPMPSWDGSLTDEDLRHMLLLYSESLLVPVLKVYNNTPLLYITDGSLKPSGQLNRFDLISEGNGVCINEWRPGLAQYKDGGYFNDSSLATGRRLVRREYANIFEVMGYTLVAHSEEEALRQIVELQNWLERAADYWQSSWTLNPIYLVHKTAQEYKARYAVIHMGSIPDFVNPHASPFFSGNNEPVIIEGATLRIEHGIWTDRPVGILYEEFAEEEGRVPISSFRNWTVSGWEVA